MASNSFTRPEQFAQTDAQRTRGSGQDAQRLSAYANQLTANQDHPTTTSSAEAALPNLQIADDSSTWLGRLARGTVGTVEAVATGAYDSAAATYHGAVNLGSAAIDGVENAYAHRADIAQAVGDGIVAAASFPVEAIRDPSHAASQIGNALSAVGDGVSTAGSAIATAAENTGSWIYNHPLETAAMVGAAAVEIASVGTATPVLAGLGALGAAGTVHSMFSLSDHLQEHGNDISVLANANSTPEQRQRASDAIAQSTGGDALGLVTAAAGVGVGRAIGALRGGAAAERAGTNAERTAAGDTPQQPRTTHDANERPTTSDSVPPPKTTDSSGRPLADGNAERVAEKHPPLTAEQLRTERAAVENDLQSHHGSTGGSILDQLNGAGLSESQRDRVLNVLAETRSSYMRPGADGTVPAEQLGSYRHTIGELKAGLESSKTNGLTPRETQDALLAGMLSDSHKYGWSAAQGGNFFTHHLDGALAADTILGRQLGDGFNSQDLNAVRHAILEHQISPPQFMADAYAAELQNGMRRAGVAPTAEQQSQIENIRRLMADPMHSPTELDGEGGLRLAFNSQERELLRRYVGEGTQNWHVPAPDSALTIAGDGPNAARISAVTRAADIDDNYSAELNSAGQAIRGPFKIANLRGPASMPPDLSLDAATEALRNNMRQSEALLTDADRARLASPARQAEADQVYSQARAQVGEWLAQQLGHAPDANTPYWGRALSAPPAGANAEQLAAWKATPDVQLAAAIQQRFAQILYEMRRIQN